MKYFLKEFYVNIYFFKEGISCKYDDKFAFIDFMQFWLIHFIIKFYN